VRNGHADNGGGILAEGRLALAGARVTGNLADGSGGGVHVDSAAAVSFDFTAIVANEAWSSGGGLFFSSSVTGVVTFQHSEIRDNLAGSGGGLFSLGSGTFLFERTSVSGNEALAGGGLVFFEEAAEIFVTSSTIDANRATHLSDGRGGGIVNYATLFVVNGTISGNSATMDGGGLFNGGHANLYNTTVAFNEADSDADPNAGRGGGAYNGATGILAIRNSVFAGNSRSGAPVPDDCFGALGSYGHNRFSSFDGCAITQTGACGGSFELLASTAELGPLVANGGATRTHAIQPGSSLVDDVDPPCICQDQNGAPIAHDQRDGPRVVGARCDVGAFELGALPPGSIFADGFESGGTYLWD
jgi:hypothetical protein